MADLHYDNYIFDLYGTLVDIHTDEYDIETWNKWAAWFDEKGLKHPSSERMRDDFFTMDRTSRLQVREVGKFDAPEIDVIPIYARMFADYGNDKEILTDELLNEAGYAFRCASRDYMRLFDGAVEYMEKIRKAGKHLFILSNAQHCYTWPEVCHFGLQDMVEDVIISSDHGCMKPDRRFFDVLINKHNLDRGRTVMIGDNYENDFEGAVSSGLHAVWVGPENPPAKFFRA